MFTALIVDDDPLLCNAMRLKIDLVNQESQLGLDEVITANSAYEAYSMMQKKQVDILITDVQMPYQSGLELIEAVSKEYPDVQLVVLSGYSYYEYMRSAMLSGVVDYLLKPVKLRQLKEILIKCLENIRTKRNSQEDMALRRKQTLDYRTEKYCSAISS